MKPWREVAVPNADVLSGTFQQSEFAADLSAVRRGMAPAVYQDARTFYGRTFITEGMRLLLTQVAERLNGRGGEPVIQLQTSFGGGKTHTLLAVYHLATRACPLSDLPGIPPLLERAGLMDVPRAKVAVLDGNAHPPGQPWKQGTTSIHTLWGELAYQLGGPEAYETIAESDRAGTSPGKDRLAALLQAAAPCVVLVDELVAYVRQFTDGKPLPGGTYDTNLSFIQALTEAAKQVPSAMILGSLPESETEAGSALGLRALGGLEKVFGRVQALWKPVGKEESFEIVRRRLFEPLRDEAARDAVCAAFAALYRDEGARVPSETHEARYVERLRRAYPIHPEVFDRLYEDWSTLDSFQRTRGVLKLMASVIYRLWKDAGADLMLLPSSLPLADTAARNELTQHLGAGWDAVIDRDIDGERSEAMALDTPDPRFGPIQAARRVARTIFLGSAPSSVALKGSGTRGIERGRILLGCLQPGQAASVYVDALNRLSDRLHYLSHSGDKAQDGTRFWFDVRANLRREMEDRKGRFEDKGQVRARISAALSKALEGKGIFDGVHVFVTHADVPDDSNLRLVVLEPGQLFSTAEPRPATDAVLEAVRNNGSRPRVRTNRLLFLAPDRDTIGRLREAVRTALAWASIVSDVDAERLNVDQHQKRQAEKERQTAETVVERAARDTYKWLLCPGQREPTDRDVQVEAQALNTGAKSLQDELRRVCEEQEWVIAAWSPFHLRTELQKVYWKSGAPPAVRALAVFEDMQKYLYFPRLRGRAVFDAAVLAGAKADDYFGTAYGQAGEVFEGFRLADATGVAVDSTLLLIDPAVARAYVPPKPPEPPKLDPPPDEPDGRLPPGPKPPGGGKPVPPLPPIAKPSAFFGAVRVNPSAAKAELLRIADEIIATLAADPDAELTISVELHASFPSGAPDGVRRAVSDNAKLLEFQTHSWE